MASLIVLEGHSSKTLLDLEKRVRDVSCKAQTGAAVWDGCNPLAHAEAL